MNRRRFTVFRWCEWQGDGENNFEIEMGAEMSDLKV